MYYWTIPVCIHNENPCTSIFIKTIILSIQCASALLSKQYLWKFLTKITLFWDNPKALWLALSTKMYIISIERKVIKRQSNVSYYMYHRYYGRENFTFTEKEYWTKISVNSPLLCINKSTTQIFWVVSNSSFKLQIKIPMEMTSSHAKLVWYFELYMWHF